MYFVRLHRRINQIQQFFDRIGLWHHENSATVKETRVKIFYSIYFSLYLFSISGGALTSESSDESIILIEAAIILTVLLLNLLFIIWKKDEIIEQLHQMCVYSVEDQQTFTKISKTLNRIMKFVTIFWVFIATVGMIGTLVVPFIGNERTLFFNIAFPLNWKESEFGFWMALLFYFTEVGIAVIATLFFVIKWYLMVNCAMKYEVLGNQLRNLGAIKDESAGVDGQRKISRMEMNNAYARDLIAGIESYEDINKLTNNMASFLSIPLAAQLTTSALCICGSIYSLAFSVGDNVVETIVYGGILLYNIFNIYLVMHLGNEINLTSDRLSYCLFESDWVGQPQPTLKLLIIFGEQLKQPQQLVILKLYPITLETFRRILNSAYNMFNILQNLK